MTGLSSGRYSACVMNNAQNQNHRRTTMASQASTLFESSAARSGPVVELLVSRAVDAQHQVESWLEPEVDSLLLAVADRVASQAHPLAVAAVEETGMGNVADKTFKNRVASIGIYEQMAGQKGHGEIAFDAGRQN